MSNDPTDPLSEIGEATGLPMPGTTRDEDDWEGFLLVALDSMEQECFGISNTKLAEVEAVVGTQLPFEVGMLLIMGVPEDSSWVRWDEDPQKVWDDWNSYLVGGVQFDVEHNGFWLPEWGPKPAELGAQLELTADRVAEAPPLFPLYGHRAVPLTTADGQQSNMGNPVLSVVQTDVIVYGVDLAAWMHQEFGVPLPVWSADTNREFPFWSVLTG